VVPHREGLRPGRRRQFLAARRCLAAQGGHMVQWARGQGCRVR
jgi:hypothetical protein